MSANAPARGKARKTDYYKWAVGVGVPIAVALIALMKPGSGGDAKTSGNFTYVGSISVIENQYQQITGQPLKDEGVKAQLTAAVNLAKAGQYEASLKILEQVAPAVPVPAVFNTIGSFYAEKGNAEKARENYQLAVAKDPSYKPALENLKALQTAKPEMRHASGGRESEPNNDILNANLLGSDGTVDGEIAAGGDTDFFRLTTGHGPRDLYRVSLKNNSTTLMPDVRAYDPAKNQLFDEYRTTPGADLERDFSPSADSNYYVQVSGFSGTSGAYSLSIKPLHRFDRFEPNDDIASAKPIALGSTLDANIMDSGDNDYYVVKSGSAPSLTVTLKNTSTTLMPSVFAYDPQKNQLFQEYRPTSGADLERKFDVQPNTAYYIRVAPFSTTWGAYSLTVK
jgi:tetratricopeptide (TPR) repeat protein